MANIESMEKELSDLAGQRTKALEGLSRRDRTKMVEISNRFHTAREKILSKYAAASAEDNKKAEAKAKAKAKADAEAADKLAAEKQAGKK